MHLGAIIQAAQQAAATGKPVVINGSIEDFIDQLAQESECDDDCEDCPLNRGLDGVPHGVLAEEKPIISFSISGESGPHPHMSFTASAEGITNILGLLQRLNLSFLRD